MTVADLMAQLAQSDPSLPVILPASDGCDAYDTVSEVEEIVVWRHDPGAMHQWSDPRVQGDPRATRVVLVRPYP